MAINQVSLFFYAPRWRQQLTPTTAQTGAGTPVVLASAVPVEGGGGSPVSPGAVKGWFGARGFTPVEWGGGNVLERGRVRSLFGDEKEIIVHVHDEAGEVTSLYAGSHSCEPIRRRSPIGRNWCACCVRSSGFGSGPMRPAPVASSSSLRPCSTTTTISDSPDHSIGTEVRASV